ncbi:hypothetical protein B9479_004161 [Cryptococcus floricola]|uniref:rhamnogalacturonan endolyase n=1 Tax=Cryptococcus floricola TaxID=2591691 RepID=A0A5D3AX62_9TREE|nr:hypothetical protein B9479_004161 [Cryptococcus floricola]
MWKQLGLLAILGAAQSVVAEISYSESNDTIALSSSRLTLEVNKTLGALTGFEFDGIDVLGPVSGRVGMGYFDCYCIPAVNASVWSPDNPNPQSSRHYYVGQSQNATFEVHQGNDTSNNSWIGLIMSETYESTGQLFQQWWFLREDEPGFHTFTRLQFDNGSEGVDLGNLQEFRQVISPNSPIWTHLVTNEIQYGHLPSAAATANETTVQDATWYFNVSDNNPYVSESSDYFTKYEWADLYGDHFAHGFYADGSSSNSSSNATTNGTTLGLWTVFNNLEGYTGGPLRSDLVVDTNIYNYYASNHRGASTMNITSGFDRIFGPTFIYLNKDGDLQSLYADAKSYSNSSFATDFYDDVADLIPGYTPSSQRGDFNAQIELPANATNAKVVLAQNGVDFQDNYWANVSSNGTVSIPRVRAGTYRVTVYAEGVFGQFEQDDVVVSAGDGNEAPFFIKWKAESNGAELWRIGVPDKTAGEFRHGFAKDSNHSLHQEEYRQYWGVWDFPTDFPNGVNYTIGRSDPAKDWNYVHYSIYGGTYTRPGYVVDNVNVWTVNWAPDGDLNVTGKTAALTIQLAGARTASGNLDIPEPTSNYSNVDYTVRVNDNDPLVWTINYNQSSSCSDRNGIACYTLNHLFTFPGDWLNNNTNNVFKLELPYNASGGDVNFKDHSVSVLYDAIRLELSD